MGHVKEEKKRSKTCQTKLIAREASGPISPSLEQPTSANAGSVPNTHTHTKTSSLTQTRLHHHTTIRTISIQPIAISHPHGTRTSLGFLERATACLVIARCDGTTSLTPSRSHTANNRTDHLPGGEPADGLCRSSISSAGPLPFGWRPDLSTYPVLIHRRSSTRNSAPDFAFSGLTSPAAAQPTKGLLSDCGSAAVAVRYPIRSFKLENVSPPPLCKLQLACFLSKGLSMSAYLTPPQSPSNV
ncbi:hypothetical protein F5144DRAFT_69356 [Chaetomium tenue]|uniref:Uncharacterized protein n=1 Tax=Chaetomium tenue TaxID=1854479 RepID=A0ACB7PQA1_9PEZI|nr:hypothetical protein F5144DRAFT_69356 [Chaetomium globosum]